MQVYAETIFYAAYLAFVITIGIIMLRGCYGRAQYRLFGAMAIVLALNALLLCTRAVYLLSAGRANLNAALIAGAITNCVATAVFYVLLYFVWRLRYHVWGADKLTGAVYLLALARIVLCLLPQNGWFETNPPAVWAICRNIPYFATCVIISAIFYKSSRGFRDAAFSNIWLAVILSFAFHMGAALFSPANPICGLFIVPELVCFSWIILKGYSSMRLGLEPFDEPRLFSKPSSSVLKR